MSAQPIPIPAGANIGQPDNANASPTVAGAIPIPAGAVVGVFHKADEPEAAINEMGGVTGFEENPNPEGGLAVLRGIAKGAGRTVRDIVGLVTGLGSKTIDKALEETPDAAHGGDDIQHFGEHFGGELENVAEWTAGGELLKAAGLGAKIAEVAPRFTKFISGGLKARAGAQLAAVEDAAGEVLVDPVKAKDAAEAASKLLDYGDKDLPQVIKSFAERIAKPGEPMNFSEARRFYEGTTISKAEWAQLSPRMQRALMQFRSGLGEGIHEAAARVDKGAEYLKAMGSYENAARIHKAAGVMWDYLGKRALETAGVYGGYKAIKAALD